jgi:tetratricopeptide (TPR) repeat protein
MTTSSRFVGGQAKFVWVSLAIVASLAILYFDSSNRYIRICASLTGKISEAPPKIDPSSPTGYELGMRTLILPQVGVDGCHWIMHTQKMLAEGGWRIRFTDNDNVPAGREIHWSHGFIWWLVGLGKIHSSITGFPLPASVEAVAPYANTLLLAILIVLLPWAVLRQLGPLAACGLVLALPGIYVFFEFFMVGNADHHGIAATSALICGLFLAVGGAGWIAIDRPTPQRKGRNASNKEVFEHVVDSKTARRFFLASAAAGSVSLWVSAATAVPTFFGIGLGVLVSAVLFGGNRSDSSIGYHPELWRLWGFAGCCGSLFFYLLEYFPSHMGMRLEVNHPLYSLAWLGGGEILFRLTRWRVDGLLPWQGPRAVPSITIAILMVVTLPLLVALFPERFFWVYDHFLWSFHKDYIHEFKTFPTWLKDRLNFQTFLNFSPFPILILFSARLLMLRELGRSWRGTLTLILMPALFLTLLGLFQVRWLGIANALWISTIPIFLGCVFGVGQTHRFETWEKIVGGIFAALLYLAYPQASLYEYVQSFGQKQSLSADEAFGIFIRDRAHALRRANPDKDLVIVSGPTTTTYMMYFGGMRGVGTLYWENVPGLKATAEIYAARTHPEASELVKKHGVTHFAIFRSDAFAYQYTRLLRGLPYGSEPTDAFIPGLLFNASVPVWLKPIPCQPPKELEMEWVLLAEVKPDQTPSQAHFAWSEVFEAKGDVKGAMHELERAIAEDPNNRDAWFRIGTMQLVYQRNVQAANESIARGSVDRSPADISHACTQLGINLFRASYHAESVFFFRKALEAIPVQPSTTNALAWLLATSFDNAVRNPTEALALAEGNVGLKNKPTYLDTLAAAQAACGKIDDAIASVKEAIALISSQEEPDPENPDPATLTEHLKHYETGLSFRTGTPK